MERRKFLIGLGALGAGSAAAMGTGAFSTGEIDRGMEAHIANDSDAYVQLVQGYGADHMRYENGRLVLSFKKSAGPSNSGSYAYTGNGLNDEALSYFDSVFFAQIADPDPQTVQKNGGSKYVGWITTDAPHISFYYDSNESTNITGVGNKHDFLTRPTYDGTTNAEKLWLPVGVRIDLRNTPGLNPGDDFLQNQTFTFHISKESRASV